MEPSSRHSKSQTACFDPHLSVVAVLTCLDKPCQGREMYHGVIKLTKCCICESTLPLGQ